MSTEKPSWLGSHIAATQTPSGRFAARLPQCGDICVARGDATSDRRLVYVYEADPGAKFVRVALLAPETENATASDLKLVSKDTALPYELLLQSELIGPMWLEQIEGCHSGVEPSLEAKLSESCRRGQPISASFVGGRPLEGPLDPRWSFKQQELARLHELVGDCLTRLVDGALVDPAVLISPLVRAHGEARTNLLEGLMSGELRIDADGLAAISEEIIESLLFDRDLWSALHLTWNAVPGQHSREDSVDLVPGDGAVRVARVTAFRAEARRAGAFIHIATVDDALIRATPFEIQTEAGVCRVMAESLLEVKSV